MSELAQITYYNAFKTISKLNGGIAHLYGLKYLRKDKYLSFLNALVKLKLSKRLMSKAEFSFITLRILSEC